MQGLKRSPSAMRVLVLSGWIPRVTHPWGWRSGGAAELREGFGLRRGGLHDVRESCLRGGVIHRVVDDGLQRSVRL